MQNILEEVLTVDAPERRPGRHPSGCQCPRCRARQMEGEFFWDWLFPSDSTKTSLLSSDQLASAVDYNRRKARSLGWEKHRAAISKLIGFSGSQSDEQGFAQAVAGWQSKNGYLGKDVDGKLGSGTWEKMQAALNITPFRGPLKLVNTPMPSGPTHVVPNPNRSYATPDTIKAIEWIARKWHSRHPDVRVRVGDLSLKGGGSFGNHKSHRIGMDADISLIVNPDGKWRRIGADNRKRPRSLMVKNYKKYRDLAKEFVELILSNPVLNVKVIWFFDHKLHRIIPDSVTSWQHYRHFHVRFCMPDKYKSELRTSTVYRGSRGPNYNCR